MNTQKGMLAAVMASSIWGGMYIISRLVLPVIPPITLTAIRMMISAGVILGVLILSGREWRLPRAVWGRVIVMGVVGYTLSISAQFIGTALAGAALGSLITTAAPLVTIVLASIFKIERVLAKDWLGISLGATALILVYLQGENSSASLLGMVWLLVAAVSWGVLGIIGSSVVQALNPLLVTGWASMVGCLGTLPLIPFELTRHPVGAISSGILMGVLYLGVVSTAGAFTLWVYGISQAGSVRSGIAFFAQPLVGSLLGVLLLGEKLNWSFGVAGVLLFAAALLTTPEFTRRHSKAEVLS